MAWLRSSKPVPLTSTVVEPRGLSAAAGPPTAPASPVLMKNAAKAAAATARTEWNGIMGNLLATNVAADDRPTRSTLRAPVEHAKPTKEARRPMARFGPLRLR